MKIVIVLSLIYVIIVVVLFLVLLRIANKYISKGKITKSYTRFTMILSIASVCSMLLMIGVLVINSFSIQSTSEALNIISKGIAPVKPKIVPDLIDSDYNHFFSVRDLASLEILERENWSFFHRRDDIAFYVRNDGQGTSGYVNFYLRNENDLFRIPTQGTEIKPFDSVSISFIFFYKDCFTIDKQGPGKEDFLRYKNRCNESLLEGGFYNMVLKVDCKACQNKPECYSFKICIYNDAFKKEDCESNWKSEMGELKLLEECPEGLFP